MTDYNNTYGGAAKDGAEATILGTDIDTQLDSLETHVATKADKVTSPDIDNLLTMDGNGNLKDSTYTIQELLQAVYPVGSFKMGPDPTALIGGTWVQLAEGTFLMNTVAGADPSGGNNDNANVAHTHSGTTSSDSHSHTTPFSTSSGNSAIGQTGALGTNFNISTSSDAHTHTMTTDSDGESATDRNRPLYVGVPVWERTV